MRRVLDPLLLELNVMPWLLPALVEPDDAEVVALELLVWALAENAANDKEMANTIVFMMSPRPDGRSRPDNWVSD
ncbi:hypothetical protein D9M68_889740 [compost metagenome]